jgi:hypothetical protein
VYQYAPLLASRNDILKCGLHTAEGVTMSKANVLGIVAALAVGALGYRWLIEARAPNEVSPLLVMVAEMRTRGVIEHERDVTVWYKTCPEVPGVNPAVLVIWPSTLNFELDLTTTQISLQGEVLKVSAPAIRADEPSIPTEAGQYIAQSSIWTLASDRQLVLDEMRKASPLARHLTGYFLQHDSKLTTHFRDELEALLRSMASGLNVPVSRVDIEIAPSKQPIPARPFLALCEGSNALANGVPFARLQPDGSTIGIYPRKPTTADPRNPTSAR